MNNKPIQELDIRYESAKFSGSIAQISNLKKKVSLMTFSISMLVGMLASVLAILNPDPQNCSVIPHHAGCVLNRPNDIKRNLQNNGSFEQPISQDPK